MALLPNINVGTSPNDGTGDSLRDAFTIVNENFQLIEAFFPNSAVSNLVANITSTGTSTFNIANVNVVNSTDTINGVNLTTTGTTVFNIANGNVIHSGAVYSSIFGNAGALYYGNIATADQPNITSLGNLSNLTVTGPVTTTGNITANFLTSNLGITTSTLVANASALFNGVVNFGDAFFTYVAEVNQSFVGNGYVVTDSDYTVICNVSGFTGGNVIIPNADVNGGRILNFIVFNPDDDVSDTTINLRVRTGSGNIFSSPNTQSNSFTIGSNISSHRPNISIVSTGTYWIITN